jgi:hypothetical protein
MSFIMRRIVGKPGDDVNTCAASQPPNENRGRYELKIGWPTRLNFD